MTGLQNLEWALAELDKERNHKGMGTQLSSMDLRQYWRERAEADTGDDLRDEINVSAQIPHRLREYTLESFPRKDSELYREVSMFLDDRRAWEGLFLAGGAGIGKTGLGTVAFREMVVQLAFRRRVTGEATGRLGLWMTEAYYLRILRRENESGPSGLRERAATVPVLFFDDLGANKRSEFVDAEIFDLLDARYRENLPIIATSNLPLHLIDDRILGRLYESCRMPDTDEMPDLRVEG